ncbi:MAG: type II toxin-antitoxin system VapC family toxin [Fibrobacterota bacterium]
MNRVLIDTNIYSAFKLGEPSVVLAFRSFEFIGIDTTVIGELLAGFGAGKKAEENGKALQAFVDTPRVHFITHDFNTAEYYSVVVCQLRRNGRPIPTNDVWIAASALRHGLALYTNDKHFESVEGLALVRP